MVGYMKAEEAAERWNVSVRQVQRLCGECRIEGVIRFGKSWAIPENAPKPTRTSKIKPGRKAKTVNEQEATASHGRFQ